MSFVERLTSFFQIAYDWLDREVIQQLPPEIAGALLAGAFGITLYWLRDRRRSKRNRRLGALSLMRQAERVVARSDDFLQIQKADMAKANLDQFRQIHLAIAELQSCHLVLSRLEMLLTEGTESGEFESMRKIQNAIHDLQVKINEVIAGLNIKSHAYILMSLRNLGRQLESNAALADGDIVVVFGNDWKAQDDNFDLTFLPVTEPSGLTVLYNLLRDEIINQGIVTHADFQVLPPSA